VIGTVLDFFKVAIAWPSAIVGVLSDVSLAAPFDAVAVIIVSGGPMRPLRELAILWIRMLTTRAL
jgi:hypothetical protein